MTAQPKIEAAKRAAEFLESIGETFHANAVRSLCRSNSSLRDTCSRLSRDNAKLREK